MAVISTASGCFFGTKRVSAPSINASTAADKAMELYDKNGDGLLDKKELEACPGMLAALKQYDSDGNQQISRQEIVDRINAWKTTSSAMATVDCRVTLDGRPLSGAVVRFVPEPFLADVLHAGSGETVESGVATIAIAAEDLPEGLKRLRAMNPGVYKVEITHPKVSIPEKYNKRTTLGREVSRQTTASPYELFDLTLK